MIPLLLFVGILFLPFTAYTYSEPQVFIEMNGHPLISDVEPIIRNDRTLVPLRIISENLGVQVQWNQKERKVSLNKDGEMTYFFIGKPHYIRAGRSFSIDTMPIIYKNRTMVPLRAIAELYGVTVDWNQNLRTVLIGDYYREKLPFEKAIVRKVISGDTIVVDRGRGRGPEVVRLLLVNTPKNNEFYEKESLEYTRKTLSPGKNIYLEEGPVNRDPSGNLLRYVWVMEPLYIDSETLRETCFNANLIINGCGRVDEQAGDIKYSHAFLKFQENAKEQGKGLWWTGDPENNVLGKQYKKQFHSAQDYMNKMTPAEYFSAHFAYERANGEVIADIDALTYCLPGDPLYKKIELGSARFYATEREAIDEGYVRHSN